MFPFQKRESVCGHDKADIDKTNQQNRISTVIICNCMVHYSHF